MIPWPDPNPVNHPGGLPEPSKSNEVMTMKIPEAWQMGNTSLQEHIIVARAGF